MRSASSMTKEGRRGMKKKLLWTLAALAATPLSAGVVYVPVPGYQTVGNFAVEPRILISNQAPNDWAYRPLLLAADTDGTAQTNAGPYNAIEAGKTRELLVPAGHRGLIQFVSAPQLVWSARLVRLGDPESQGSYLPVITSEKRSRRQRLDPAAGLGPHRREPDRPDAGQPRLERGAVHDRGLTGPADRRSPARPRSRSRPLSSRVYRDTLAMAG
jgi:hypothetical protein